MGDPEKHSRPAGLPGPTDDGDNDENNYQLKKKSNVCYTLTTWHLLIYLILTSTLRSTYYYYPHFTDEETEEAQMISIWL